MIVRLSHQLSAGFMAGWRTRNGSFLGIVAISLGLPILLLAVTALSMDQRLSWQLIKDIGTPFWGSLAFCVYLLGNKTLQVYHQNKESKEEAPNLVGQFDIVVFVVMIGLIARFAL
jgi:hypothetical protein